MKSVSMAVFAAVGLILAMQPGAFAGDRPATNYSPRTQQHYTSAQANLDPTRYERKCMILPCGTRWCYNVKR